MMKYILIAILSIFALCSAAVFLVDYCAWLYDRYCRFHIGRWKRKEGSYMTPGGTPIFVCAECGGTEHLHGAEFPYRKMYCEDCGSINAYPWEKLYEEEN